MSETQSFDRSRPYLVIPKLVEQPTWGGQYIATVKGWLDRPGHDAKIGQAYELFSGSNLSLIDRSDSPDFKGELTDRDAVQVQTRPENSVALADMVAADPQATLGVPVVAARGPKLEVLIKYTQALGNSFQVHIKAGVTHPVWKPKPESWYYFEPGILTLGIKHGASWEAYQAAVTAVSDGMQHLGTRVQGGEMTYEDAQVAIADLLEQHNPWQYVNTITVDKDDLVDLSSGGIHHSWEEDPKQAPLGNVLYELQAEAMDDISTFRSFDKGKMGRDGSIRSVHIKEYFDVIDRSPELNDPAAHLQKPTLLKETDEYRLEHLMESPYYILDKLTLNKQDASYTETPGRFRHLFVKNGSMTVRAGDHTITVTTGHSCFVPAAAGAYTVVATASDTQVLISS